MKGYQKSKCSSKLIARIKYKNSKSRKLETKGKTFG